MGGIVSGVSVSMNPPPSHDIRDIEGADHEDLRSQGGNVGLIRKSSRSTKELAAVAIGSKGAAEQYGYKQNVDVHSSSPDSFSARTWMRSQRGKKITQMKEQNKEDNTQTEKASMRMKSRKDKNNPYQRVA